MNLSQVASAARYVVAYGGGFVTAAASAAVALHIANPEQAKSITDAFGQILSGVVSITGGVSTLAAVGAAIVGALRLGIKPQIAAVQAHPSAQVTVSDPALKAGIPGVILGPVPPPTKSS